MVSKVQHFYATGFGTSVGYLGDEHLEWKQWHTLKEHEEATLIMIVHEMDLKRPMLMIGRSELYLGNWTFV